MVAKVHIGRETHEFISIEVIHRLFPESQCYHDANWVLAEIKCCFGAFSGNYTTNLRTEELEIFLKEIRSLNKTLKGKACFKTMEEQVFLSLKIDNKGGINFSGKLIDDAGSGNTLYFEDVMIDQSFLLKISNDLEKITEKFPILFEIKK